MIRSNRHRRVTLSLTLLALAAGGPARGQEAPRAVDSVVVLRPLPVLDYAGNEIPDSLIVATMRPAPVRAWRVATGALLGMIVFAVATVNSHDCSIYDPCSQREKYLAAGGWLTGFFVGGMLGAASSGYGIDRARAVEIIRDQRLAESQRQEQTPKP